MRIRRRTIFFAMRTMPSVLFVPSHPLGFDVSAGYAGEPGASAPSVFLTGNVPANNELYKSSGSVMAELVKVATEVGRYLPAYLPPEKKTPNSIRIEYDEQDVYLGREPAKVET